MSALAVERWNPERHLPLLGDWLIARGQATGAGNARMYPSTGFVVDQCAAGFIYATNAPLVGYVDGIVTDPAATVRRRHTALERLCAVLLDESASLSIELLVAFTNVKGLLDICKRAGFRTYQTGFECIARTEVSR